MTTTEVELLRRGAAELNIEVDGREADCLLAYRDLLAKWNKTYNLTAVRDPAEMLARHLLDSITVQPFLQGRQIADIGTGAGLPGVPLAILNPSRQFTLIDSNRKKLRFIEHVRLTLQLSNLTVEHARLGDSQNGQTYSTITARALADLSQLCRWGGPLLADGGQILAQKAANPEDEIARLPADWRYTCEPLVIPGSDIARTLVILQRRSQD